MASIQAPLTGQIDKFGPVGLGSLCGCGATLHICHILIPITLAQSFVDFDKNYETKPRLLNTSCGTFCVAVISLALSSDVNIALAGIFLTFTVWNYVLELNLMAVITLLLNR